MFVFEHLLSGFFNNKSRGRGEKNSQQNSQSTFMLDRRVLWVGDTQGLKRNRGNPSCAQQHRAVLRLRPGAGLGWGGLDRALPHLQKELVSFLWCSTSFCPFRKSSAALNIAEISHEDLAFDLLHN